MKRFLVFLCFLFLVLFSFWFFQRKNLPVSPPSIKEKTETITDDFRQGMKKFVFQEQELLFLEQKISEAQKLNLLSNFEQKFPSTELFENNNCQFLINGGFYDEQDQPLGWFFSNDQLFKREIKSALFNGFLFQTKDNEIFIEDVLPSNSVIWGLQAGPILIFNSQPLKMSLVKDERARRAVAAINQKKELFFLIITGSESLVSGPYLADLPLLVEKIGQELNENFQAAINLDGGTASSFINQEKIIKEYTWVGSFFCLQ